MKLLNFLQKKFLIIILACYLIIASAGIFYNYSLFNTAGDEGPLLSTALKMIAEHNLRPNYPTFYHLPLAAYLYLPFFVICLILMRFSGLYPSLAVIEQFGQIDFAKLLPLARFISVLCGLACLYLVYKICEKLFSNKTSALLAAFFLSVSLLFVQTSHFARIWLPQTLTVLLALYFIVSFYRTEKIKLKNYLLCGLGVGLAFATHVVGVFTYFSFLAAHYLKNKKEKIINIILNKYFWLANFLLVIIYFATYYLNPYGFVHYLGGLLPNFSKMLFVSDSLKIFINSAEPIGPDSAHTIAKSLIYYLTVLWQYEPLLLLLAIAGSIVLLIKRREVAIIIYSFILTYFLGISLIGAQFSRYILPIVPFLAIISAYGLSWLYDSVKYKKTVRGLIIIICLVLLYPPLLWDQKFLLPSSRLEAAKWVYQNLSQNESIINFDSHLELNENRESLEDIKEYTVFLTKKRAYLLNSADEILPQPNYYIFFYPHYKEVPPEILNKKFNFLIISWRDRSDRDYWLDKLKDVNLSVANLALLKRFPDGALETDIGQDLSGDIIYSSYFMFRLKQNGPIVDIYQIKYSNKK